MLVFSSALSSMRCSSCGGLFSHETVNGHTSRKSRLKNTAFLAAFKKQGNINPLPSSI